MKSLFKKSTYILSAAMLLFACGGKEAKKPTTVVETKTSKTKTLEIEKPQLTFGFIKLTDMAPLAIAKKDFLKMKDCLFLWRHNLIGKIS
jgi:nitrate/nitrite transport system substrate-binding protein